MSDPKTPKTPPEGRATDRIRHKMAPLLTVWYGESRDSCVMMNYLPETAPVGKLMDSLCESLFPKNMYVPSQIRDAWPSIAGVVAAKNTLPLFLNDGVLKIEVAHPAYLMSLNSKRVKDSIVARINSMFGEDVCVSIVFIPAGKNARPSPKDRGGLSR